MCQERSRNGSLVISDLVLRKKEGKVLEEKRWCFRKARTWVEFL